MQKAPIRERVTATFAAVIMLVLIPLPFWAELFGAGVIFFACSRFGLPYASRHALRMLDLTITFAVVYFVLYLLQSALQVVAHDAGMTLPLISNGLGLFILKKLLTTAYLLLMLGFLVYALLGRELKIGLSMGMLEALRGRRVA
jgi:tryptophan-rich sensory protein